MPSVGASKGGRVNALSWRLKMREGQCPQLAPQKAGGSMPSVGASIGGRVNALR